MFGETPNEVFGVSRFLKNARQYSVALPKFRGTAEPRANAKSSALLAVVPGVASCCS